MLFIAQIERSSVRDRSVVGVLPVQSHVRRVCVDVSYCAYIIP